MIAVTSCGIAARPAAASVSWERAEGRVNHMYTIGKRENANPGVLLAMRKAFQEGDDEKMVKSIQKIGELIFNEDSRFSDLEFNAVEHDIPSNSLILSVVYDPADNAKFVRMNNIYALNISKFGLQNVISHVEFFRGDGRIARSFLKVAEADGFHMSRQELPEGGEFFVGIFVPANGATIYIICDEVEKVSDSGVATYRI
ncbi:hypothetical protein SAMN05421641_1362 [Paracoccus thiocyanatus]|uniref:Uncharacterized protein n=1 Tax=Paracoccus thiocyanatus TaxID=34006 RepID=A0A1N6ZKT8_9RHOB|nr:hypothetical protein [Paracoccus thiocyanatus]SIR27480.1 hypothetical protein SAMN05421641_1362 [Paracoccus thiocyanatus]